MDIERDRSNITWHMSCYIFYNMHQLNIPRELSLSGDQIRNFESDMYIYCEDISKKPLEFLNTIYKNYCEINKVRIKYENYIYNFLHTYVEDKILKSYKNENYEFLFKMIFSDVMKAYIIEIKSQSPTMFITEKQSLYKYKCIEIIYNKIQHYVGINIHRCVDPNLETVPLEIYNELLNNYKKLQKKFNKLKKNYNKLKKEIEYESE